MSNLINYTPISFSALLNQITLYKYNPSAIQRVVLDNLYQATQGQADIVDPTNPFVFLLEASCVNTALAIQESLNNLQKQYPKLAQNFSDLYLHMSDMDYLGLFSSPSQTDFTWKIQLNTLIANLQDSPSQGCKKAVIPRNTYVTVGAYSFSLNYPIEIRQYYNGYIEVIYDGSILSPLQQLSTNVIPYSVLTDADNTQWLMFTVPMMQFNVQTTTYTVQASTILNQKMAYSNEFYYARAFYQNSTNAPGWTEISTTYTQQVYDAKTPTISFTVDKTNSELELFLPPVYVDSGLISGQIRIDLYTTLGQLSVNLSNYQISSFVTTLYSTDPVNDINEYSSVLPNVSYVAYSANTVVGGSNGTSFDELRQNVIDNSTGSVQIPITNVQLASQANLLGFQIVKNADYITNRIFQATAALPAPSNPNLITPAAISLNTLYITPAALQSSSSVINNLNQSTIPSNTIFVENNGILSIYSKNNLYSLLSQSPLAITQQVNSSDFLYNPFYYVLDYSENEFSLRAYDLDDPSTSLINFIEQNQTLSLIVNTGNIQIRKTPAGYTVTVTTSSGALYQALNDNYVQAQLSFIPIGETTRAYVNATLAGKTPTGERIFEFDLNTSYSISTSDGIELTNFFMFNTMPMTVMASLVLTADIFYCTTSITTQYVPSKADAYLGKFLLPQNTAVITHEQVDITLGYSLSNLWRQSLVNQLATVYQTYSNTVVQTYVNDVYATDATTGSIFTVDEATNTISYNIIHHAGDPVLDSNNQPVYRYRSGDIVLDSFGNPVISSAATTQYACDLLLVDGKYFFATDPAYRAYQSEIRNVLVTWITQTLDTLKNQLLEQTEIYFYPEKATSNITVNLDVNTTAVIAARQSFIVDIYLTSTAYADNNLREQYQFNTILTIGQQLKNNTVSIDAMIQALRAVYDSNVISFNVKGLGGANNYDTVTIANLNESLSLNKVLSVQEDGTITVKEDVTINFFNYQTS